MSTKTKRVWKIPVEQCEQVSSKRGRKTYLPKQLTVKEGIDQTAIPILIAYVLIIVRIVILAIQVFVKNPSTITLSWYFGFSEKTYSTLMILVMILASQFYLIYLDLIRRSRVRTLLMLPGFFFMVMYLIFRQYV